METEVTHENSHPQYLLDVDWLAKALVELEQLNSTFTSETANPLTQPTNSQATRNAQLSARWRATLLSRFKAISTAWWAVPAGAVADNENTPPGAVLSPQHRLLLALSRLAFLLPKSEHAELAEITLANFARSSCGGSGSGNSGNGSGGNSGNASAVREPWLSEATIKLVAQNLQFYDRVLKVKRKFSGSLIFISKLLPPLLLLKLPAKVNLLEWICDRMTASAVADATGFTGPLLHYLQDLLDDLYNLPFKRGKGLGLGLGFGVPASSATSAKELQEEVVALLYKISKVAYWISYLLGPRSGRSKYASKVKDLEVVVENQNSDSFFSEDEEDEPSSSSPTVESDDGEDILEEEEEEEVIFISKIAQENAEEEGEESEEGDEIQEVIDVATALEQEQQQNEEEEEDQPKVEEAESNSVVSGEILSSSSPPVEVVVEQGQVPNSVAFEVIINNSMSNDDEHSSEEVDPALKKKSLRLRRQVLRRLRRLCRNVRDDCNYQLQKYGH